MRGRAALVKQYVAIAVGASKEQLRWRTSTVFDCKVSNAGYIVIALSPSAVRLKSVLRFHVSTQESLRAFLRGAALGELVVQALGEREAR